MSDIPTASIEQQEAFLKAAEARYTELGVSPEQAAQLFDAQLVKLSEELGIEKSAVPGDYDEEKREEPIEGVPEEGGSWLSRLPDNLKKLLIDALVGTGVGGIAGGAAGYGLSKLDPNTEPAGAIAGGGLLGAIGGGTVGGVGGLADILRGKSAEYKEKQALAEQVKTAALEHMDTLRIPRKDAEFLLETFTQEVTAQQKHAEGVTQLASLMKPAYATTSDTATVESTVTGGGTLKTQAVPFSNPNTNQPAPENKTAAKPDKKYTKSTKKNPAAPDKDSTTDDAKYASMGLNPKAGAFYDAMSAILKENEPERTTV